MGCDYILVGGAPELNHKDTKATKAGGRERLGRVRRKGLVKGFKVQKKWQKNAKSITMAIGSVADRRSAS
jgi:hypothetical protein